MKFAYPLSPDPDDALAPLVGWYCDDPAGRSFPAHQHRRGQLLSVARGLVVVNVGDSVWVVPPNRAAWIPPLTEHSVRYPMGVAMRSLFVDVERLDVALPASCAVFELDALAREMVKEIADYAWDQVLEGANAYVVKALLARLSASRPGKIFLPAGKDPRVVRTMNHLRQHPAANERVETLAARVHCSHRTLARLFVSDTGMSVGAWRTQLKLQAALERIASGTPIGTVAIELGHDPSTFSTLFKKTLGVSPARYFS